MAEMSDYCPICGGNISDGSGCPPCARAGLSAVRRGLD